MSVERFDNTNFTNNTFCSMIHFILRIVRLRIVTLTVSSQCFLLNPLKTSENSWLSLISWCFPGRWGGGSKGDIGKKRVKGLLMFIRILANHIHFFFFNPLILSWRRLLSYRNQSIDLLDWFLYDNGLRNERVKRQLHELVKHTQTIGREIADELFECVWPLCGIGA